MTRQAPPTAQDRARLQQAMDHLNARRFEEAEAAAAALLAARPGDGVVLNLLGAVALKRGDFAGAVAHLRKAAKAAPADPMIAFNLGEALRRSGDPGAALAPYQRAKTLKRDFAEADAFRGEALRALGDSEGARGAYQTALAIKPQLALALNGLGLLALQAGDGAGAARHFEAALKAPAAGAAEDAALHANFGIALSLQGRVREGVEALLDAIDRNPGADEFKRALARMLRNVRDIAASPRLRAALIGLFQREDVNPRSLATAALAVLRADHDLAHLNPAAPGGLLADELFLLLLANAPIPDAELELFVTALRQRALEAVAAGEESAPLALLCALAQQCFLNEYAYFVADQERQRLAEIAARDDWRAAAILGAYTGLAETPFAARDFADAPAPIAALAALQIEAPRREAVLKEGIERFAPVADAISLAVQSQYEENPFPRWTRCDIGAPASLAEALRTALPNVRAGAAPTAERPRVLIAGCGTGLQTAHAATAYRNASILAIDLSRASLAYGMRKLAEYGIGNVRHMQADILDLARLNERFDLIESFGVIHHMHEPARGLAALSGLLDRGGLIFLGLYSAIGRGAVAAARDWIAARGYPATPDGVRRARRDIITERPAAMAALLSPASDFWTTSDCRDLIFHVQEHRYTLLEIADMLAACDLEFLGLQVPNAADRAAFAAEYPAPQAGASLAAWHAFETAHPNAFGETYRIWARKR